MRFSSQPAHGFLIALLLVTGNVTVTESQVMHTDQTLLCGAADEKSQKPLPRVLQASHVASALRHVVWRMQRDGVTAANVEQRHPETYSTPLVRVDVLGRIHTAILVTTFDTSAEAALATQHVQLDTVDLSARVVQAWIPFNRLDTVAVLPFVRSLRPPSYARRR